MINDEFDDILNEIFICIELEESDLNDDIKNQSRSNNRTSSLKHYVFDKSKLKRHKRQADQYEYTPTKTRCPLLLVADYRFFQEMGSGNTKTTINYLVRLSFI